VEGLPLYRYQLRLRLALARALDLLAQYDDLTALSVDLGFSSHIPPRQSIAPAHEGRLWQIKGAFQLRSTRGRSAVQQALYKTVLAYNPLRVPNGQFCSF
jgi:hypothetical protein